MKTHMTVTINQSGWSDLDPDFRQLCKDAAEFITNRFGSVEAAEAAQRCARETLDQRGEWPCGDASADAVMSAWFEAESSALGFAVKNFRARTGNLIGDVADAAYVEVNFGRW